MEASIVQNGNAYDEGFGVCWDTFNVYWADPENEDNVKTMGQILTMDYGTEIAELIDGFLTKNKSWQSLLYLRILLKIKIIVNTIIH